jgi:hypothetical protein
MSSKEETVVVTNVEPKEEEKAEASPVLQEMVREEKAVSKCCSVMKEDVHIACKCCSYSWCITLNGIEGCCFALSKCCLFASELAMGCNKFLEQIDCDKH